MSLQRVGAGDSLRRSPLDAWFREHADTVPEALQASLRFEDLSCRIRCGCKGAGAQAWLTAAGYRLPSAPNSAAVDDDGVLVARVAASEFLIEAVAGGFGRVESTLRDLESAARPPDVYPVGRFDLVVRIEGRAVGALLRQICSVDFSSLLELDTVKTGPIVLTSMMGVGAMTWPRRVGADPSVTVWIDPSFAHYFWTRLLEVGRDLGNVAFRGPTGAGNNT